MTLQDSITSFSEYIENYILPSFKDSLDEQIVIWGTGNCGQGLYHLLRKKYKVVSFCDGLIKKRSAMFDLEVDTPSNVFLKYPNATYLVASTGCVGNVIEQNAKSIDANLKVKRLSDQECFLAVQYNYLQNQCQNDPVAFTYKWLELYRKLQSQGQLAVMQKELLSYFDDDLSKDIINTRIDAFTSGDVAKVFDIKLTDNQYFSKDCVALTDSEVFIDCGSYDGDSIRAFLNCTQGKYKQIIAIEPDPCNFQKLYAMAVRDDLVGFRGIKSVTGASNGTISFAVNLGTSSKVSEVNEGLDTIEMRMLKLDNLYNEKPTYIKMDIEGAELDTLKGCERIIKDLKPKLAICVYHKPFDIFDIPKYLKSLVPEYKFKLRQHQLGFCEVVLYASVD